MSWEPSKFLTASTFGGPDTVYGYVYRGLGLYICMKGSPKGRRPPTWMLTHLGTGHRICMIDGTVANAFPIATEIADCGDWEFDGLKGWVNRDPELPTKFRAIIDAHSKQCRTGSGGGNEEQAVAIAMARA